MPTNDSIMYRVEQTVSTVFRYKLLLSLGMNALLFLLFFAFFSAEFLTERDTEMMLLLSGTALSLEPQPYVLHIHIWLSSFIAKLYTGFPGVPWYSFVLTGGLYTASVMTLLALIRRHAHLSSVALYIIFFFLFYGSLLRHLNYQSTAAVLSFAAFLQLIPEEKAHRMYSDWFRIAITVFVSAFSVMLSAEGFVLAAASVAPVVFLLVSRRPYAENLRIMSVFGFLVVMWLTLDFSHELTYSNNPELNELKRSAKLQKQFEGIEVSECSDNVRCEEILNELGWSVNDFKMLKSGFTTNDILFNADNFEYFLREYLLAELKPESFLSKIESFFASRQGLWGFPVFFFTALLLLRLKSPDMQRLMMILLLQISGGLAVMLFFSDTDSVLIFCAVSFAAILPVLLHDSANFRDFPDFSKVHIFIGVFLGIFLFWEFSNCFFRMNREIVLTERIKRKQNVLTDKTVFEVDKHYIIWGNFFTSQQQGAFSISGGLSEKNILWLRPGASCAGTGLELQQKGIDDLYTEICENTDYRVLIPSVHKDEYCRIFKLYMREHHKKFVASEVTKDLNDFCMVRFFETHKKSPLDQD